MALVTLVVVLVVGVLLIVGSLILGGRAGPDPETARAGDIPGEFSDAVRICREPHCGCRNKPGARFCARCGTALTFGGIDRRE